MRRTGLLWVALVAIAIYGCSTERTKPPSAEQPAGAVGTGGAGANLSNDDFVRDVTLKNMGEVELSRMALDKATNLDIKAFAQRMIDDHGAAGNHLKSVLSGKPVEWPVQLDFERYHFPAKRAGIGRKRADPGAIGDIDRGSVFLRFQASGDDE